MPSFLSVRPGRFAALLLVALALSGCAVVTVAGAAVGAASIAVDAAVGAVKLTGRAVAAAADLVIPDSEPASGE
jgi:hypothetical protein